jgi:transcription elongation factor Elf1
MTSKTMCPRCGANEVGSYPALSRRDNKTDICSNCGQEEALYDLSKRGLNVFADAKEAVVKREEAFAKKLGLN